MKRDRKGERGRRFRYTWHNPGDCPRDNAGFFTCWCLHLVSFSRTMKDIHAAGTKLKAISMKSATLKESAPDLMLAWFFVPVCPPPTHIRHTNACCVSLVAIIMTNAAVDNARSIDASYPTSTLHPQPRSVR